MKSSPLQRKTPLRSDAATTRAWVSRSRRNSPTKPRAVSPASKAQRLAVEGRVCVNCGRSGPCDPAHLTPRSMGGCDDGACVISLCRICHDGLDRREGPMKDIDLAPILALPEFTAERVHMAGHMTFHQCLRRLTGEREP